MCSGVGDWTCFQPGFPIRTSSNHSSVASSSRLIAGSYVLHRLLVPRHPPCALKNLPQILKMLASTMQFSSYHRNPPPNPGAYPPPHPDTNTRPTAREAVHRSSDPKSTTTNPNGRRPFPQDPTACQAAPPTSTRIPPRPKPAVLPHQQIERPTRRRSTHEQPPRNTRPSSGPGPHHHTQRARQRSQHAP